MSVWLLAILALVFVFFMFSVATRNHPKLGLIIWDLHGLAWVIAAIYAYLVAGSFQLFNCWFIILVYAPPIGLVGIVLLIVSGYWLMRHRGNPNIRFFLASHVLLAGAGLFAATVAANLGTGAAACL
ncbi:MAG: hypothetical protein GY742_03785 [Hyphomicrobiales bacterium]|nr:hypothetical protein [Hyphomicrobiales bacterium]